jgi:hypothetical protein
MSSFNVRNLLPHLLSVAVFVLVAVIYCKPALEGKVLQQSDVVHWKGMSKDIQDYRDTHDGVAPLWTTRMFGGMPGYQIATNNNNYLSYWANEAFSLFIPKPFRFFILACLGFYFLALVLRTNPWLAMLGALGYAYASYNAIIVSVGHETKMLSIAYLPALLGAVWMIYRGRYWMGAGFTALFSSILIFHNHYQIVYYFLLLAAAMTIGHCIQWIRQKDFRTMTTALLFAGVAGFAGVMANAVMLFTTYDYSKATIRGGQAALNLRDSLTVQKNTGGLDTAYAFLYGSYGVAETFTTLVPGMYGGAAGPLGESSRLVETMQEKGLPGEFANQLYGIFPAYWGQQPSHAGPVYLGAIFFLLFIFGMFYLKSYHRWWILGITLLAIMMSWGKNFAGFNTFLFEYLPMYNKFRAPAMILVIPQLTLPLAAVMALQELLFGKRPAMEAWKALKQAGIAMAAIFLLLGAFYVSFSYRQGFESQVQQQLTQIAPNDPTLGKDIVDAVVADRKSMFGKDLARSLFLAGAAFLLLFLFVRNKIKAQPVIWALVVLSTIDLMGVSSRYLNADNFMEPEEAGNPFSPSPADMAILRDKDPDYRVLNLQNGLSATFADAITSYHHKSVGGYHAAKLSIYQDLIENQLSKQPLNMPVLNMLNTKYIIVPDSTGQVYPQINPGALGSAWFVKNIHFVPDARAEMQALDNFDPASTAVVQESFRSSAGPEPRWDSGAVIRLMQYGNDTIHYECNAAANQFAVFSEVYYDRGWKAFIDGKETPIVKVNYVLRGLPVPAGNHKIEFRFVPKSYYMGSRITTISQLIVLLLLLAGLWMELRKKGRVKENA